MKSIHKLPDHLIRQIAAGEIIERPAYIVKELLDNAIDAHASHITINLEHGGLQKIIVTDNGDGMNEEDIKESYKLHTTSKIHTAEHFFGIKTLGFRGEALASIAAIANLRIESRTSADYKGTRIDIIDGHEYIQPIGMPKGTRATVDSIFQKQPVRKRLFHSPHKEFRYIMDIVIRYAIFYPDITFELYHNGHRVLSMKKQTNEERIRSLLGEHIFSHLIPIAVTDSIASFYGYIGKPQATSIKTHEYLAINRRPVSIKLFHKAIHEAFDTLIDSLKHPIYVLSFSIPHEYIDINVHPRKEYVTCLYQEAIYRKIVDSIQETFSRHNIQFTFPLIHESSPPYGKPLLQTTLAHELKHAVEKKRTKMMTTPNTSSIISIHNLYIIAQSSHGLIILDQHAAHERILYEEYLKEFTKEQKRDRVSFLKKPLIFDLSPAESTIFDNYLHDLTRIGFSITRISRTTYQIMKIPKIFEQRDLLSLIKEILEQLDKEVFIPSIDSQSKRLLAYLACRSAVKSGDPLTEEQMKVIIKKIKSIPRGVTCPHGRPVYIEVSLRELDKLFKRTHH